MRTILNINDGWKFIRQDEQDAWKMTYTDHHWEEIKIPHTWNAVDGANEPILSRSLLVSKRIYSLIQF